MYIILTFDIESCLGKEEISEALPYTLSILSKYSNVRCTFNVAAQAIRLDKKAVQQIIMMGHEVAAHGYRHDMDWDIKNKVEQEELIIKAKRILETELATKIVGWATPRGNRYHADVELLKKHGFLYVRDRSYRDYTKNIIPQVHDKFVDIPRFGYDETAFLNTSLFRIVVQKTINKNKVLKRHLDWPRKQIFFYFQNMLNYKLHIEGNYLVTNLHPYHIWKNAELSAAFEEFLNFTSRKDNLLFISMRDFANKIISREIDFKSKATIRNINQRAFDNDISIQIRKSPELAIIHNISPFPYSGNVKLKIGILPLLLLIIGKQMGSVNLTCDRNNETVPYIFNVYRRSITINLNMLPYSSSIYSITRTKYSQ